MSELVPVRLRPDFEAIYPGASREATESAMNLVKTGDMILARVAELLRPFRLSPAGGQILSMLSDAPAPLSPGEIRRRLLVSGPTVSGLVDSLERQGLVEPSDGAIEVVTRESHVSERGDHRRCLLYTSDAADE